ncbi:SPOR domain-containing protein [Roseobacter weihaiensis]|uniref:SPOR domain-containing protein n=1 Tax=Roseobacter weihaiensis TaxID=2763262 RepID=UPI001D09FB71|nr:SPOR domain-containing protein [Roseobacter sp. H9]
MSKLPFASYGQVERFKLTAGLIGILLLTGCDDTGSFDIQNIFTPRQGAETAATVETDAEGEFIEQDVEAPEVFSATEPGLWDGRPSLGGVWVAHPDVTEPERVLIRNQSNGQFVVGALFRREREIPGPRLQISSDAAQSLGVLAGAPVDLDVIALRKERIAVTPPEPDVIETADEAIDAPEVIAESTLDPIEAAGAAIDAAEPTTAAAPAPAVQSTLPVSTLQKPFIQVGIFSVEDNADRVATQIRSAGMVPTVQAQNSSGKDFWRVLVGPATTSGERRQLLDQIKGEGFSDAYAVTN